MGIRALEHMKALTDRLVAMETDKSTLLITNAGLVRDLAEAKQALARAGTGSIIDRAARRFLAVSVVFFWLCVPLRVVPPWNMCARTFLARVMRACVSHA